MGVKPKNHPFPILSWLIRWQQETDFSHMCMIPNGTTGIVDATGDGVRVSSPSEFFEHYTVVKEWWLDVDLSYADYFKWLGEQRWKEYSMWQNIGYVLKTLLILPKNPFGANEYKLVCSELIALFLKRSYHLDIYSDEYDLNHTSALLYKYEVGHVR